MRVVIDTNVLISAIFWTRKPKQILNKVRRGEITFLTSEFILEELKPVIFTRAFLSIDQQGFTGYNIFEICQERNMHKG